MMTFRQRMAWLAVAMYLLISLVAACYLFEGHRQGLELIQGNSVGRVAPSASERWSVKMREVLAPLPPWLWALAVLLPYLQLFLLLFSCTRANPQAVGYCILPICLAMLCSRHACSKATSRTKDQELIDT